MQGSEWNFVNSLKTQEISFFKILAGDDQRLTFPWWFDQMYESHPGVSEYVDGLAVHWYADKFVEAESLNVAAEKFPGKFIIGTEACSGLK